MDVESILAVGAILGEGPVWIDDALWFVDIKSRLVHRFDPATGDTRHWHAPDQVGWVLPVASGGLIAGLKSGLFGFDPVTAQFALLHDPEPQYPENRLNDATTDSLGRLWFGSMDDGERHQTGGVYRYVEGACVDTGLARVAITNGPAVSADAKILYHTDTLGKTIWRVAIHDDGTLGDAEPHISIEGAGYPDGSVIDSENCLWIGLFGGYAVRRYDPDGTLMRTVRFPVANVTKIAFGGPGLRVAYATTARKGLDAAALAAQPLAGNLFSFDPEVAGVPTTKAKT